MLLEDLLAALIIVMLLSGIFTIVFGKRGPWRNLFFSLLITFFVILAGAVWLHPAGAVLWNVRWMSFLVVGLLAVLILTIIAATTRHESTVTIINLRDEYNAERAATAVAGVSFCIVIATLLAALVIRYFA